MKKEFERKLTKNEIKAIRTVMGYTSDLRCNIGTHFDDIRNARVSLIWDFINDHRYTLLGMNFGDAKPTVMDDEWDDYVRCLNRMAMQVINGR